MDDAHPFDVWLRCVRDLEQVNRLTRGYAPTLRFLQEAVRRKQASGIVGPLRVLDVGYGGGGLLRAAALWAARQGVAVELAGMDLHPHAARAAATLTEEALQQTASPRARAALLAVRYDTGEARAATGDFEVVVNSLLMHHLEDGDIVELLRWMADAAKVGWFINDLERSPRSMYGFRVLAFAMRWSAMVRHDGPVSFRRSFCRDDWERLLEKSYEADSESHVRMVTTEIVSEFPARLCITAWATPCVRGTS